MKSGDEFVSKVKEFKEHDKNVDGLLVEVRTNMYLAIIVISEHYSLAVLKS